MQFFFGCTDEQHILTKSVHVGEDVTLKCSRHSSDSGTLFWIKLNPGNFPEVLGATYTFDNANVNRTPRITAMQGPGTFDLHITKTELSDTAFYYCEKHVELKTTILNTTLLKVEGKGSSIHVISTQHLVCRCLTFAVQNMSPGPEFNIIATIQNISSDPVHPGASVTLQCSVLSENRVCPEDHSVYWFRARSDKSQPLLIYAHGNDGDECERSSAAPFPQKCVYSFSMHKISSSDAGTYYCAVATCGQILFGNRTNLNIDEANMLCQKTNTVIFLLSVALTLSLVVIALLI
ncbi:uncharacterized protein [Channa argus]|uniref:uncharacterized protein n=1 Tax=Channa argus TaxID=215402 RepID=UPI003521F1A3